jgi:DNA-binding MarR family transcriptional regulator
VASHYEDPRITAIGLLMETVGGLTTRFTTQLADHGVSMVEFEVLMRLARSPERRLRMTDLAAQAMLTTSGITRVVDRLEKTGLVERFACESDRRGYFAVLTSAGLNRLDLLMPGHLELIEQWFTGLLDESELAAFLGTLRKIRDVVRPGATAGAAERPLARASRREA